MTVFFDSFSSECALLVGLLCLLIMRLATPDDDATSVPIAAVTLIFSSVFAVLSSEHTGNFQSIEQDGLALLARIGTNTLALVSLGVGASKVRRWDQRIFSAASLALVFAAHLLVIARSGEVLFVALLLLGVSLSALLSLFQDAKAGWNVFGASVANASLVLLGHLLLTGFSGSLDFESIGVHIRALTLESLAYGVPGLILVWAGLAWVTGLTPYVGRLAKICGSIPIWVIPLTVMVPMLGGMTALIRLFIKALCFSAAPDQWEPLWPLEISRALALISLGQVALTGLASFRPRSFGQLIGLTLTCQLGSVLLLVGTLQRHMIELGLFYLMILCGVVVGLCIALRGGKGQDSPQIAVEGAVPLVLSVGLGLMPLVALALGGTYLHQDPFRLIVGGGTLILTMGNGFSLLRLWALRPARERAPIPRPQALAIGSSFLALALLSPFLLRGIRVLLSDFV